MALLGKLLHSNYTDSVSIACDKDGFHSTRYSQSNLNLIFDNTATVVLE